MIFKILAYADDLLVLCNMVKQLIKIIGVLRMVLEKEGLVLNLKKSAIAQFRNLRSRNKVLTATEFEGFPVVDHWSDI